MDENAIVDNQSKDLILLQKLCELLTEMRNLLVKMKKKSQKKRKRRWLVRPINQSRSYTGYFVTLFQELKQDAEMFYRVTRMDLKSFNYLVLNLGTYLFKSKSNILPEERLAITLRFLATGDSIVTISLEHRIGITTCYNIIIYTCEVIFEILSLVFIRIPLEDEWRKIGEGFTRICNMPNCIGAIDGKHVTIKAPSNSGSVYFNYKKSFSVVLMVICNHQYEFLLFDVGAAGSKSDGGVLARSKLGKAFREKKLNIPEETYSLPKTNIKVPCYFVGDEAFQLSEHLMRPFPGRNLEEKKAVFNYRLSRARRMIESCFGILVSRWRFLSKSIGLNPSSVVKCVVAAVCLHNFLVNRTNSSSPNVYCHTDNSNEQFSVDNRHFQNNCLQNFEEVNFGIDVLNAISIRDTLANYFVTPDGEVSWQYEFINRGLYQDK